MLSQFVNGPAIRKKFGFFVCYHKDTPRLNGDVFTAIHAGRALAPAPLKQTIGDDVGDNISQKNKQYSEITALYWIFKNVEAEYYGLFHYRRLLNFGESDTSFFHDFSAKTRAAFGWTERAVRDACIRFDVITGPRWNVHPIDVPTLPMTNYDFYCREHHKKDIDCVLEVVKELSPDVYPHVSAYMCGTTCFYWNMFVMRRDLFKRYAEWLFSVLFEAEKRTDRATYDAYQERVWGFLAERLMGGFIDYLTATEQVRAGQLPAAQGLFDRPKIPVPSLLANIMRTRRKARAREAVAPIHVSMIVDDSTAARAGVALRSAAGALPKGQSLELHLIVAGELTPENHRRFETFLGPDHHVTFHRVEAADDVFPRQARREGCAALLTLQDLLPSEIDRVIHLDCDVIVCDGLDRLWFAALDGVFAAACPHEGGTLQARRLNFPASAGYFDAGVIVFNLALLRAEGAGQLYREALDQCQPVITQGAADVLNIAFLGCYRELELRWNVSGRFYRYNELDCRYSFEAACEAARRPAIVHFTDHPQPWERRCRHPLAMLYFVWLARTPWALSRVKVMRRALKAAVRALLSQK